MGAMDPEIQVSKMERLKCIRKVQVLEALKNKLPIIGWVSNYSLKYLYYDFIAGITIGLVAIPQCLAFGALAGLPPLYGLFSAFLCPFIYAIFGTSKDLTLSPVAILSVIVSQYTLSSEDKENVLFATALSFLSGIVLILVGILNLGVIVSFASLPVLNGYASCVAFVVTFNMLKDVFGLRLPRGNTFQNIANFFKHIPETRPADVSLGLSCLLTFVLLKKANEWNKKKLNSPNDSMPKRIARKVLWFICTARFFLVLLIITSISQILVDVFNRPQVFTVVGEMDAGLPSPLFPIRSYKKVDNTTISATALASDIGFGCVTVSLVAILNTLAAVKTVGNLNNYRVNMSQEILALGLMTFAGSFFRGFPVAGSLSRSLLNSECGVRTPLNGIFAGSIMIISLTVLTPWFKYIPKAGLASMVIAALIPMMDTTVIRILWKGRRVELIPLFVSFLTVLYNPVTGLLVGIGTHLVLHLYYNTKLVNDVKVEDGHVTVVIGLQNLLYASNEQLLTQIEELAQENKGKDIVIDFSKVVIVDATVILALQKFLGSKKKGALLDQTFCLVNVSDDICTVLRKFNFNMTLVNTWAMVEVETTTTAEAENGEIV